MRWELSESCECRSVNKDWNQSALLVPTHSLWEDQLPPQNGIKTVPTYLPRGTFPQKGT